LTDVKFANLWVYEPKAVTLRKRAIESGNGRNFHFKADEMDDDVQKKKL
jgi:hypothetical protein